MKANISAASKPCKDGTFVKDMLLRAHEKAVGLSGLVSHLKSNAVHVDLHVANEVLAMIEEKRRPTLEQAFGQKSWEIKAAILKETIQVLKDPSRIKGTLEKSDFSSRAKKENEFMNLHEFENRDMSPDMSINKGLER